MPIAAPRDIEDKLATEEAIELAKQQVMIFILDQAITTSVIEEIEDIFNGIDTIRGKAQKTYSVGKNQRKSADFNSRKLPENCQEKALISQFSKPGRTVSREQQ